MTLPSVMLAVNPHSAASDSSGIRSRLTSVSRADLVRGGCGSVAMAPLRRTRVDDSDEQGSPALKRPGGCTLIGTPALRPPARFMPRVEPKSRKRRPESQLTRSDTQLTSTFRYHFSAYFRNQSVKSHFVIFCHLQVLCDRAPRLRRVVLLGQPFLVPGEITHVTPSRSGARCTAAQTAGPSPTRRTAAPGSTSRCRSGRTPAAAPPRPRPAPPPRTAATGSAPRRGTSPGPRPA